MEDEKKIECWCCIRKISLQERSDNDGFCPHCDAEIDLEEEPYKSALPK